MSFSWSKARRISDRARRSRRFRPSVEALENRSLPAPVTLTVTTNLDEADGGTLQNPAGPDGKLSLREAILVANLNPAGVGVITIDFAIGRGPQTIHVLNTPLPAITHSVTIDGTSQPGFDPTNFLPVITLDGKGVAGDGLTVRAVQSTIRGLDIISFSSGNGIVLIGGGTVVQGNIIGTDQNSAKGIGNNNGILIDKAVKNTIGGTTPAERNVISGNRHDGIDIIDNADNVLRERHMKNVILGNLIGTDVSGANPLGNGRSGVEIDGGADNAIGPGNVISGNELFGIELFRAQSLDNVIRGNLIGLDATGERAIPTPKFLVTDGIFCSGISNQIGGTTAADRNVISGNSGDGILIQQGSGNIVIGDYIGTDKSGLHRVPNDIGILDGGSGNRIGGTHPGERNIIAGNDGTGIIVGDGAKILNNLIGVDAAGTAALPNGRDGIKIEEASGALVEGNVISGNLEAGIRITNLAMDNRVFGNRIGTDEAGRERLGAQPLGVVIDDRASENQIGGPGDGERNIISGNANRGVFITDRGTVDNKVQGNFIGTDLSGTFAIPNGIGVIVSGGAARNLIGGSSLHGDELQGAGNLISGNTRVGVEVDLRTTGQTTIQGNYIGTTASGTEALGNGREGIFIGDSPFNVIGGGTSDLRNVISGNMADGIEIFGSNAIQNEVFGNYIGVDKTGDVKLGNRMSGVAVEAPNNMIGFKDTGNVISGNDKDGVLIQGNRATGNLVRFNLLGTNQDGTRRLGNGDSGVAILNAMGNTIGGATREGQRNIISGNGRYGVHISGPSATGNIVIGNYIGTNRNGDAALGNAINGVLIDASADSNAIGGLNVVAINGQNINLSANVIAGNKGDQVLVKDSDMNTISSNYIGISAFGDESLSQGAGFFGNGVRIVNGTLNTIGGVKAVEGNVISGNQLNGIQVTGGGGRPDRTRSFNNIVGLNAAETDALGNGKDGIQLTLAVGDLIITNDIAGNHADGVGIEFRSRSTELIFNDIGASRAGGQVRQLPNGRNGVFIADGSTGDTIEKNSIVFNKGAGIRDLNAPLNNTFSRNAIFDNGPAQSNTPHGIDAGPLGPTLTSVPVFTGITVANGNTTIRGTLTGPPNTQFVIEAFLNDACDPSGFGQGQTFLGTLKVTTGANGVATINTNFARTFRSGTFITATATLPGSGTSEFSKCLQVP
jgi:hypothetical protein